MGVERVGYKTDNTANNTPLNNNLVQHANVDNRLTLVPLRENDDDYDYDVGETGIPKDGYLGRVCSRGRGKGIKGKRE